jgi:hypothetical protein
LLPLTFLAAAAAFLAKIFLTRNAKFDEPIPFGSSLLPNFSFYFRQADCHVAALGWRESSVRGFPRHGHVAVSHNLAGDFLALDSHSMPLPTMPLPLRLQISSIFLHLHCMMMGDALCSCDV